ncbi:alpha/beta hydrolase [Paraglaciecola agarilytica]|uniref:alpha/beta hydrolase n=1 Tax=Paraglaciecola chathamensis TaxID=368405 RepID=UPI001C08F7A5|nr:alpha/beta hydrolase [Paraglaciecola agarilytica]MBU3016796.1 alpha/beta hydrolase [Paraglaciecola agarilytica]
METFIVTGSDGLQLSCYLWRPAGDVQAVVHIAHGMSEHALRYERFAVALNAAGFAVAASDHRGHGQSILTDRELGHMSDEDGWHKAVNDLAVVNQHIQQRIPNRPIILLGHSMGSFMTQDYMARYGDTISAAALSATNGPAGALLKIAQLLARFERRRLSPTGHSPIILSMVFGAYNKAFKPNRTEFDWLSRDESEVDKYVDDPLCGFECSTQTWTDMLAALGSLACDPAIKKMDKTLPIYVFSGTDDPVGEKGKGVQRLLNAYQKHGFSRVTHQFYQGGRHEMLNETNRDEVTSDFIQWAKNALD